jgi:hypothetical protein
LTNSPRGADRFTGAVAAGNAVAARAAFEFVSREIGAAEAAAHAARNEEQTRERSDA